MKIARLTGVIAIASTASGKFKFHKVMSYTSKIATP
jgi:hypothetical protein